MTASQEASSAARQAASSRPMHTLTRFGFIAYGVMHGLVGWLALQIAWSHSGGEGSQSGAFATLAAQPLGKVLLVAVVVGLAALAVWQAVAAAIGHTDEQGHRRTAAPPHRRTAAPPSGSCRSGARSCTRRWHGPPSVFSPPASGPDPARRAPRSSRQRRRR